MTDLSLARHIAAILDRAGADLDPAETAGWCEALDALTATHGPDRARFVAVIESEMLGALESDPTWRKRMTDQAWRRTRGRKP